MSGRWTPVQQAVLALAVAALLVTVPGVPPPIRILVATTFFCLGPGLAWVPRLPVDGIVEQGAVAVALSLALDVLVAEALMFLGLPGLFPAALVLAGVTVAGLALTPARVAA